MKVLILAAGYATRLYPLTENFPKPLLKVGDRTILDWLIDDIETCHLVDEYIIVSNHRFAPHFQDWAAAHRSPLTAKLSILDDGTSTNETRLGAVRDIQLALTSHPSPLTAHPSPLTANRSTLTAPLLVIAGDNLLDFSLTRFIEYAQQKGTSCIMRYYEPDEQKLHKTGVAEVDDNDKVLSMVEKPAEPKSHWCCPPFYYLIQADLPKVAEAIADGCGVDAPGSFIAWLCKQVPVHAMQMPGNRYDIGNLESYEQVQRTYKGIIH